MPESDRPLRTITLSDTERIVPWEILLDRIAESSADAWISTRRFLHQNPELSAKEFQTTRFIMERLQTLGLSPTTTSR